MEAAELGVFMVLACLFTVVLEHPASAIRNAVPSVLFRRVLIGLAMGLTAITIIYSPWGRRSGAHFNPSVTLTFLRLGKVAPWDAAFYVAAQFRGGVAGVMLVAALLGSAVADGAVRYAATVPGPCGTPIAFVAELTISFVLMTAVLNSSNSPRVARFTGVIAGTLVATFIILEAAVFGDEHEPGAYLRLGVAGTRVGCAVDVLHGAAARHAAGFRASMSALAASVQSSAPSSITTATSVASSTAVTPQQTSVHRCRAPPIHHFP